MAGLLPGARAVAAARNVGKRGPEVQVAQVTLDERPAWAPAGTERAWLWNVPSLGKRTVEGPPVHRERSRHHEPLAFHERRGTAPRAAFL